MKTLVSLVVIFLMGTALVLGISAISNRSKFKVGDCVAVIYKREFSKTTYYSKVTRVGKKDYLVNTRSETGKYFRQDEPELKFRLNDYDLTDSVNCP